MNTLVVKLTSGMHPGEAEKANQALTVAATAAVSGISVSLWLAGEAAWLAVDGRAAELRLPHATEATTLLQQIIAGGTVTVCGQCATRRSIDEEQLIDGAHIRGSAGFVTEIMQPATQVVVY